DTLKGNAATGLVTGIGTVVLAPLLLSAISSIVRPVARVAAQAGLEICRGTVAPISAAVTVLFAEAQAEFDSRGASGRSRVTAAPRPGIAGRQEAPKQGVTPARQAAPAARASRRKSRTIRASNTKET
ncbi:MAG TPA: hypothetical protein VE684_03115, partial [Crenalkalicoccus sp.]|nr:hypothetical protein [Crenalkalicoccus sp.]